MKNRFQNRRIETQVPQNVSAVLLSEAVTYIGIMGIESVVCAELNIEKNILHAKTRRREILFPKQIVEYFLSCSFFYTYHSIGQHYKRDRATVYHSKKVIEDLLDTDKNISKLIANMAHNIIYKAL